MNKKKQAMFLGGLLGGGSGVAYETPSYSHALGSGARPGLYAGFSTSGAAPMWGLVHTNGLLGYAFDGDIVSGTWAYTNNGVAVAGEWMEFSFVGQASPTYKADKIKFNFTGTMNAGEWNVQAYIGAAWVNVGNIAQLGASAEQEIALTGALGFTKLRILGVSGTSSWNANWCEVRFSIGGQL